MHVAGLIVCVTGAASGIGEACARLLADLGAHLLLVDKEKDRLRDVAASLPGPAPALVAGDLTDPAVADEVMLVANRSYGPLDAVVFAAGVNGRGALEDVAADVLQCAVRDNVLVHFHLSQRILQERRKNRELGCSLVYIASKLALAPSTGFGAYPIAKAGELQLARMVAIEGGRAGIRANVVNPGAVVTGTLFWDPLLVEAKARSHGVDDTELEEYYARRTLLRLRIRTEDVAWAAAFLVSPWSRAITGAVLPVDGGLPVTFSR